MIDSDDLSPELGGPRAAEPEPPAAEPEPEPQPTDGPELPPELAELFAEIGGAEILGLIEQLGPLSQGFERLVSETFQAVEERLPSTLSAIEGLFGAVEEALGPFLGEDPPAGP